MVVADAADKAWSQCDELSQCHQPGRWTHLAKRHQHDGYQLRLVLAAKSDDNHRMMCGEYTYIWQASDWPNWRYDLSTLVRPLAEVSQAQGKLLGRLADVGMLVRDQASLATLTEDVVKSSAIEGELLNVESVRSSIARRIGVDIGALAPVDRHVEGVVDLVLDATMHYAEPLTAERLYGWHAALFPIGYSGLTKIRVGGWRDDASGPMHVVSGPVHRQQVHYEAPPADRLEVEMGRFLQWANGETSEPALIKAGLAHLWFVTVHPFDDGNGRIARAISALFLARSDESPQRFYSLSAQIQHDRTAYYDALEATQQGTLDVTDWLSWFLATLHRAIDQAAETIDGVIGKTLLWQQWRHVTLNERQIMMLNRLLDGFEGKLTNRKWAIITKCSPDTALRDINDLLDKGILAKAQGGGRSSAYELVT